VIAAHFTTIVRSGLLIPASFTALIVSVLDYLGSISRMACHASLLSSPGHACS
jgi:hypothetical protein